MKQNHTQLPSEAATDEPASSSSLSESGRAAAPPDSPNFEPPPLLSDCLGDSIEDTLADTFTPESRKPRHDGWTAEAVTGFLHHLAATGIVEHAARAVGLSAQSAYAFRNRRHGRAFARMWDALLVHRSRARIASELQARAIAGCVSIRKRDGEVVGEYHYYDNRLAMAMLTRLDRLAEREAPDETHLRALSEDLDGFCQCLAEGGDADAFVEAHKPAEAEPEPTPEPDPDPELTTFATLSGCAHLLKVDPHELEVRDLDLSMKSEWSPEQWVRAFRSGFMTWAEIDKDKPDYDPGPGTALCYFISREAARASAEAAAQGESEAETVDEAEIDTSDLHTATIWEWTDDQLVRAWRSGFLTRLRPEFWGELAAQEQRTEDEE